MPKEREKNQTSFSYVEYFVTTTSPKLKKKVNIKKLLDEELEERFRNLI